MLTQRPKFEPGSVITPPTTLHSPECFLQVEAGHEWCAQFARAHADRSPCMFDPSTSGVPGAAEIGTRHDAIRNHLVTEVQLATGTTRRFSRRPEFVRDPSNRPRAVGSRFDVPGISAPGRRKSYRRALTERVRGSARKCYRDPLSDRRETAAAPEHRGHPGGAHGIQRHHCDSHRGR